MQVQNLALDVEVFSHLTLAEVEPRYNTGYDILLEFADAQGKKSPFTSEDRPDRRVKEDDDVVFDLLCEFIRDDECLNQIITDIVASLTPKECELLRCFVEAWYDDTHPAESPDLLSTLYFEEILHEYREAAQKRFKQVCMACNEVENYCSQHCVLDDKNLETAVGNLRKWFE